jgi:hypothetical protein
LGHCAEAPSGGGSFEFWIEPCRRGLFGFDWGPVRLGPYARITVPTHPVLIDEIQDEAVSYAAALVRLAFDFSQASAVEQTALGVALYK